MIPKAINKLFLASIEKGLIKNEKELTVNFVRNKCLGINLFGDTLLLTDGYGKEHFINILI